MLRLFKLILISIFNVIGHLQGPAHSSLALSLLSSLGANETEEPAGH